MEALRTEPTDKLDAIGIQLGSARICGIIVGLGAFLRLFLYVLNPSLWEDEAKLASTVLTRDFGALLELPDFSQPAPLGYMVLVKILTLLLGESEVVLRFPSLVGGIGSLVIIALLTRKYAGGLAGNIVTSLAAFSPYLVYYTVEFRSYSLDMFFCGWMLLLAAKYAEKSDGRTLIAMAILGALSVWLCFPMIFVLAAVGVILFLIKFIKRDIKKLLQLLALGTSWLFSFAGHYFAYLKPLENSYKRDAFLFDAMPGAVFFAPIIPTNTSELMWWLKDLPLITGGFLSLGVVAGWIFMILVCFGFVASMREKDKQAIVYSSAAVVLVLYVISVLHIYPVNPQLKRIVIYTIPVLSLLSALGLSALFNVCTKTSAGRCVTLVIAIGVTAFSLYRVQFLAVNPPVLCQAREVIQYMGANIQPNDIICITDRERPVWKYYSRRFGLSVLDDRVYQPIGKSSDKKRILEQYASLPPGGRAWLFIATRPELMQRERELYLSVLGNVATVEDSYQNIGAELYLLKYK